MAYAESFAEIPPRSITSDLFRDTPLDSFKEYHYDADCGFHIAESLLSLRLVVVRNDC